MTLILPISEGGARETCSKFSYIIATSLSLSMLNSIPAES